MIRFFKRIPRKRKIQLGVVFLVVIVIGGILIAYKYFNIFAAENDITNTATITYNEGGVDKSAQSNTATTVMITPSPTPSVSPSLNDATFALNPETGTYEIGQTFSVDITLNTGGNETAGSDVIISYDNADLEVLDEDSGATGVQIKPGSLYTNYPQNIVSDGNIMFSGVIEPGNSGYNGTGTLATIRFKTLKESSESQVNFVFLPGSTDDSNVASMTAEDLLGSVTNGNYVIIALDINLTFTYQLQGRTNQAATGISIQVFPSGESTPAFSENNAVGNDSGVGQITIPGLSPGNYDFKIQVGTFLAKKLTNKTASPTMSLDFSTLLGGDLDGNNIVNSLDFSIMVGRWGTSDPAPDINRDGKVNSIDFAYLNANWFVQGE